MPRKTKQKLDEYHWHEALDRSSLALEWFAEFVEEHPAVRATPSLRKRARKLSDGLFNFYQAVANVNPNFASSQRSRRRKGEKRRDSARVVRPG